MFEVLPVQNSEIDLASWIAAIAAIFSAIFALASTIILFCYTRYTYRMQQTIARQVKIQIRQTSILKNQVEEQSRQTEAIREQVRQQIIQTKELVYQRRLGNLPFIVIQVKEDSLEVSNLGNGVALNIKMKSVKLENLTEEENSYRLLDEASIEAPTISLLKPGEATNIKVTTKSLKENNPKIIEISHKIHAGHLAFGIIEFQDIEGNSYNQDLRENENKVQRHSFPKLVNQNDQGIQK